jgi:hypothetical protein
MDILRLLYDADRVVHIALNLSLVVASLVAFRRTRQWFFWLIVAGSVLQVCLSSTLFMQNSDRSFHLFYRAGVLVAVALLGPGLLLLVRYVLVLHTKGLTNRSSEPLTGA